MYFFPSSFLSLESKRENVSFCISFICMSLIKDTLFRCWDGVQMLCAVGFMHCFWEAHGLCWPHPLSEKEAMGKWSLSVRICAISQKLWGEVRGVQNAVCLASWSRP